MFMLLVLSSQPACAGMIYKCRNTDGKLLYQEHPCPEASQAVNAWNGSTTAENESGGAVSMVLTQGMNGHYFVDGAVNGQFLNFVIDTGASMVSLPQGYGDSAKLKCLKTGVLNTANGDNIVCKSIVQQLKFGTFTLYDVEVLLVPNLSQPLMGMNVLKRFQMEQNGSQLKLTKSY